MCASILNVIFIIILIVGTLLLMASFASPAWKEESGNLTLSSEVSVNAVSNNIATINKGKKKALGLFRCGDGISQEECQAWFDAKPTWEKVVIGSFVLSLCCCGMAFVWSCVACCMCCCKSCLTAPLPILTGLATVLAAIAVIVYAVKTNEGWDKVVEDAKNSYDKKDLPEGKFGYALFLGVGGTLTLALDTIVGVILAKTAKISPI